MKSPRASNSLRTWWRQICIRWWVWYSRDVIHIRWTSKRKSATLRTIVLVLFDYRLIKHYKFSITCKSELLLGQSKTPTASRRSRSLVFAVCGVRGSVVHEHGWSCNGWLSRCGTAWMSRTSSKFRQAVMFALDLDQWQFAITGKVPQHPDGLRRNLVAEHRQDGSRCLKGRIWCPQGSPYRAYQARIPRAVLPGISKIRPMAAAFIPATEVPTTRHRWASAVLFRLFGGNTAIQTPRTVRNYGLRFRNYWFEYHETW